MMSRGQASIEFFLIVSFILALMFMLQPLAQKSVASVTSVDDAALARSAAGLIAANADYVWLAGNGSVIQLQVRVPATYSCAGNSTTRAIQCVQTVITEGQSAINVTTPAIYSPKLTDNCGGISGWKTVKVASTGDGVEVGCP